MKNSAIILVCMILLFGCASDEGLEPIQEIANILGRFEVKEYSHELTFIPSSDVPDGATITNPDTSTWGGGLTVTGDVEGEFLPPLVESYLEGGTTVFFLENFSSEDSVRLGLYYPGIYGDSWMYYSPENGDYQEYHGEVDFQLGPRNFYIPPTQLLSDSGGSIVIQGEFQTNAETFLGNSQGHTLNSPDYIKPMVPESFEFMEGGSFRGDLIFDDILAQLLGNFSLQEGEVLIQGKDDAFGTQFAWEFKGFMEGDSLVLVSEETLDDESDQKNWLLALYKVDPTHVSAIVSHSRLVLQRTMR